ncbi:hypothetical protein EI94DRAFT_1704728 [Lactarius quietus]|nr:hypothetical protein EI94DRAFT_1704728 [Lactarius quietus]
MVREIIGDKLESPHTFCHSHRFQLIIWLPTKLPRQLPAAEALLTGTKGNQGLEGFDGDTRVELSWATSHTLWVHYGPSCQGLSKGPLPLLTPSIGKTHARPTNRAFEIVGWAKCY